MAYHYALNLSQQCLVHLAENTPQQLNPCVVQLSIPNRYKTATSPT